MTRYESSWVRAHTNIALIKYWGKADDTLIIPANSSLSLTLDAFYTDTQVAFGDHYTEDTLTIDGIEQTGSARNKAITVLELVRKQAGISLKACITSRNHVPTAAGLASSASGLAALAGAAADALNLDLSTEQLTRLARRGSGSACRSVLGGFVLWEKGYSDDTSVARSIDAADWDIGMLFVVVNDQQKDVSSRIGMQRTVDTSVFYSAWLDSVDKDLVDMQQAIQQQDVYAVGEIAERNALKMHATTLGAVPPFTYWSADSLRVMDKVRDYRRAGHPVHFTMDAGPNVKVIGPVETLRTLQADLTTTYAPSQLILAQPGPGITFLS